MNRNETGHAHKHHIEVRPRKKLADLISAYHSLSSVQADERLDLRDVLNPVSNFWSPGNMADSSAVDDYMLYKRAIEESSW